MESKEESATMASIEASCPACGPVICRPGDFDVRVWKGTGIYYVFTCPGCSGVVQKQADLRALNILLGEGLTPTIVDTPFALDPRPNGPPFTADDLLDLHILLERPDWFQGLRDAG